MKSIVQFGAGNIGRSLVGQLFSLAGYRVVFVEARQDVVRALNERREYSIVIKDTLPAGSSDNITVQNVCAVSADQTDLIVEEIAKAELISTAVGPAILEKLCPVIAAGLKARSEPISIILCENLRGAAGMMRRKLSELVGDDFDLTSRVGLVETSIGKMVPIMPAEVTNRDPLVIWAEAYNQIIADRAGFIGPPPEVTGLVLKDNFNAYVDRKLFIHNLGHSSAAYFGFLAGKKQIWQCVADESIRRQAREAMWASADALIAMYPSEFNKTNQAEHIDDLLQRFANRALNDSVYRVGRDLYRKLSADDRCMGAIRLIKSRGLKCEPVHRTVGAALCFKALDESGKMFAADEKFHSQLQQQGPEDILHSVCGLNRLEKAADDDAIDAILKFYQYYRDFSRSQGC